MHRVENAGSQRRDEFKLEEYSGEFSQRSCSVGKRCNDPTPSQDAGGAAYAVALVPFGRTSLLNRNELGSGSAASHSERYGEERRRFCLLDNVFARRAHCRAASEQNQRATPMAFPCN